MSIIYDNLFLAMLTHLFVNFDSFIKADIMVRINEWKKLVVGIKKIISWLADLIN